MLSAEADLEKGLTMEVDMPETITGFWIGLVQTLDVRRTTSAAKGAPPTVVVVRKSS
jgi:hypothetical protein